MNTYAVSVYKCGVQQGRKLTIQAVDGLEACNTVEVKLGLKPPEVSIDVRTGKLSVAHWHGYEFRARLVH